MVWPNRFAENFETDPLASIFPNQVGTTASLDGTHTHSGTLALHIHKTGVANSSIRPLPSPFVHVGRLWWYPTANPTATIQLYTCATPSAVNLQFSQTTAGHLAAGYTGTTIDDGIVHALNTWHAVDFRFDMRFATWTCEWMVDGTVNTQSTVANPGTGGPTNAKFDNSGAVTIDYWIDDWQYTDSYNAYPLADAVVAPTNATITLTTNPVTANATLNNQPGKALTPSVVTATAALVRMPTKALTSSQATATAALARLVARLCTSSAATASATLARTPVKPLTANQATASATLTRTPIKALTSNVATASASLVRLPVKGFTTAAATVSAQLIKMPGHVFTTSVATASAVLALVKVKTLALTASVVTASAFLVRTAGHVLTTAPATANATLIRLVARAFTTSIATASATLRRTPGKTFTASQATATATLTKTPTKALTASQATASASLSKKPSRTLTTSTATASAQLRRAPIRVLTASATATSNLVLLPITGVLAWPPVANRFKAFAAGHGLQRLSGLVTGRTRDAGPDGLTDTTGDSGRTQP